MRHGFLEFSWDPKKAERNRRKHGIEFREAAIVFGDNRALTYYDDAHSIDEKRFITIGMSNRGRVLVVSHTAINNEVRIISARKATRRERTLYEKETE